MGFLLWLLIHRSLQLYLEDKQQDLVISIGKQVTAASVTTDIYCGTRDVPKPPHDVILPVFMIVSLRWDLCVSSLLAPVMAHSPAYS